MKKRGYLLIECILYIWFCAIFSSMILTLFLPYIKEFKNEINASTNYNYILSASMYIENTIFDDNIENISVDDNKLKVYISSEESLEVNEIKVKEISKINKLVVERYRLNSIGTYERVATNTILKNVENFYVVQNGKIITIFLKQYNGEERIFCYEDKYTK